MIFRQRKTYWLREKPKKVESEIDKVGKGEEAFENDVKLLFKFSCRLSAKEIISPSKCLMNISEQILWWYQLQTKLSFSFEVWINFLSDVASSLMETQSSRLIVWEILCLRAKLKLINFLETRVKFTAAGGFAWDKGNLSDKRTEMHAHTFCRANLLFIYLMIHSLTQSSLMLFC